MLKAKDLRNESIDELVATLKESRRKLFDLVNQSKQSKKLEKPHHMRETRKDIAKLLTVINEKTMTTGV